MMNKVTTITFILLKVLATQATAQSYNSEIFHFTHPISKTRAQIENTNKTTISKLRDDIVSLPCKNTTKLDSLKTISQLETLSMTLPLDTSNQQTSRQHFRPSQLITPTALISIGILGVTNGWTRKFNRKVTKRMTSKQNSHIKIDDISRFLPLASTFILPLINITPHHNLQERLAITSIGTLLCVGVTQTLKKSVKAERPDLSDTHSFPSGHTSFSFLGAEILRSEYRDTSPWIGIAGYSVATATGLLRIYNNKHYLTDVFAGAGIGILSARVAYWLLPWERRLFGWDKQQKTAILSPYITTQNIGFSYSVSF